MKNSVWRAVVEVGFIIFLFYSNLLMGEMERSAGGRNRGLLWDLQDIFTRKNFVVAIVAALVGYVVVERLRDGRRYIRRKEHEARTVSGGYLESRPEKSATPK